MIIISVFHRWNRNHRPEPDKCCKPVCVIQASYYYICLNCVSGFLVWVGCSSHARFRATINERFPDHRHWTLLEGSVRVFTYMYIYIYIYTHT